MRTYCGLAAAFLLAVAPGVRAQLDSAPTPVPLPIPIAAASAAMPAQDLDALRAVHAREINDLSTFRTAGLQREAIDPYLDSAPGQQFLRELRAADPAAPAETIYARAVEQLASGSTLPDVQAMSAALVKIVPHGQNVSPYSPYFTTSAQLQLASGKCASLADCFGLPLKSEAPLYDVYQVMPKGTVSVFVSQVAPTEELGGLVRRRGGAQQYLLPNRSLWSAPVLIGTIKN
ncbi:hypothetical protein O3301_09950 [Janthinobacterium sp. SUN211]|uniref:hypothetical protein n=1 Tax=Janthinobacterium sp. SUN211 TaxID=3014786 RepID=UPI0027125DC8|nr:hypothetical protein [Janthinobacterium sp. SUN211]MDO8048789.1 hypothetical protein [Janthinobacterium sp. SUN211]